MTLTISPQTEALLQQQAGRLGQRADDLADNLLLGGLEMVTQDYEETCQAISEALADAEAGRVVSFEDAHAQWKAQKAARPQNFTFCAPSA